jgi:2-methylcitrate dehydratase PrpD
MTWDNSVKHLEQALNLDNTLYKIYFYCRYIQMAAEAAKRSPELIQLLELHTQFATITPYSQVSDFLAPSFCNSYRSV